VGRKIAERLAVELRDKIGALGIGGGREVAAGGGNAPSIVPQGRLGEVHGALLSLGYKPAEFEGLLPKLDPAQPAADLIKQALAALRRK
jgi:Holliday junction DNA helicase RuvA